MPLFSFLFSFCYKTHCWSQVQCKNDSLRLFLSFSFFVFHCITGFVFLCIWQYFHLPVEKTLLPLCSTLCCSSSLMLKYGDHNLQTPASTFEFDHWIISYFQKYIFSNFQAPSCWNQQEMQIIHCKLDPNADRHR